MITLENEEAVTDQLPVSAMFCLKAPEDTRAQSPSPVK